MEEEEGEEKSIAQYTGQGVNIKWKERASKENIEGTINKFRSGKLRKFSPLECSLSRRCLDDPD